MKYKISNIRRHPKYTSVLQWGKLISITGSAQIIIQAIGFACGILVIRLLPVEEYALYTLANAMLGTMTILADGGISTGVMSQGGKVWQDKEKLGAVIATGLDLRRKFAVVSLIVATPILLYLLVHNGASWLMAIMISLALIPAFYAALSDSLLEVGPKLHQTIIPLQKNQISVGIGRLILSAGAIFIFPWTFVAILASGIPRIYGNIKLKKISIGFIDTTQQPDPEVQKEILKLVRRMLPSLIYFSLSGQITLWIISIIGNTTTIAELGALGRVAALFSLFNAVVGTLLIPRFSRLKNLKPLLIKKYTQILFLCFLIMFLVASVASIFSNQLLWILGNNYSKLSFELILNIIIACLSVLSGIAFSLYSSRGWILHPLIPLFKNTLVIVISVFVLDLTTLTGALYMNLLLISTSMIMNILYGYYKLIRIKN